MSPSATPRNLAILVHDDVEVLDFCGPFEAFGVPGDDGQAHFNVFTVADEERVVRANIVTGAGVSAGMHRWAPEDEARVQEMTVL